MTYVCFIHISLRLCHNVEIKSVSTCFQISMGLMRSGAPVRSTRVFVRVSTNATASEVVAAAIQKMSFHLPNFRKDKAYKLRYPDGRLVTFLPESDEPFSLGGYKRQVDKDYNKVILYITCEGVYYPCHLWFFVHLLSIPFLPLQLFHTFHVTLVLYCLIILRCCTLK